MLVVELLAETAVILIGLAHVLKLSCHQFENDDIVEVTDDRDFVRKDVFDIARYGTDKGLRMCLATNGTLVNNEMVTEAQLTHGARIRIGNTKDISLLSTLPRSRTPSCSSEDCCAVRHTHRA